MNPSLPYDADKGRFVRGQSIQLRVIGALILREIHARYGRENIGYLWLIGEPMLLASVIGAIHSGSHARFGTDVQPLPLAVLGYTIFIIFRQIVNRAEGALESNTPLLYHKMVSLLDIMIARSLIEAAGTVVTLVILFSALILMGQAGFPARPLWLILAVFCMVWISFGQALIIAAASNDNRTIGRLIHVYSYFNIPLSAAFFQVEWLPHPYREYILWTPLPHIMEMARFGQFESATDRYFDFGYVFGICLVLTWIGLVAIRKVREHMHVV